MHCWEVRTALDKWIRVLDDWLRTMHARYQTGHPEVWNRREAQGRGSRGGRPPVQSSASRGISSRWSTGGTGATSMWDGFS